MEGVIRAKDGGVECVREVWEMMGLSDMLSQGVLMKEQLSPPEF